MTNIPFPNPHESDALNDYLDELAAGKQAIPESELETAAQAFHHLASRAEVNPETQQSFERLRGEENMHTATWAAPVSNRTRRQIAAEKRPGKSYGWLSAVIVAGLMISLIGAAWLNREPGNPNENLAWAPGTAEPFVEDGTPWTQPISFTECPADAESGLYELNNLNSTMYTEEDYEQVSSERSYEIVGPADPEDADAVMTRMRETQACIYEGKSTLKWTVRFEYETRTTDGRVSVEENAGKRSQGAESVSKWLEDNFGFSIHDLMVYQDPDELTLDGTESVIDTGLSNPGLMVEFSDGRIGIIQSLVTYEPFPEEWDFESIPGFEVIMTFFVYQDGEWMLDENLPMCIGDCSALPTGTPVTSVDPIATPEPSPRQVAPTPTSAPRGGDNRG